MTEIKLHGGRFDYPDTANFLAQWQFTELPYLIAETVHDGIQFTTMPAQLELGETKVLRLHCFGPGGDLQLRHDAGSVYWRFVGLASVPPAPNTTQAQVYNEPLHSRETLKSMLWGVYDDKLGRRYEARVGQATLDYPRVAESERAMLTALEIVNDAGDIMAIWTTSIEAQGASS